MSEENNEDSPLRCKRQIKRIMVVQSSSGSDSEDSIGPGQIRKRRLKVLSEDDQSDSSGSSVVAGTRFRRTLPKLEDSDGDGDSYGWVSDNSDRTKAGPSSKALSGFSSDSSEGNSDKCSICLMKFKLQVIGIPQSCEHVFCLDCITEWSKNVNTCPVDRITFNSIVVRTCVGGRVLRVDPVKEPVRRPSCDDFIIEDATGCQICTGTEAEETMLLCDSCDLGFHMHCLNPRVYEIPEGLWFCPNCNENEEIGGRNTPPLSGSTSSRWRQWINNAERSVRYRNIPEEPSTSTGSRQYNSGVSQNRSMRQQSVNDRDVPTRRRKRRQTRTLVIEYTQEGEAGTLTKKVKRKRKKKTRRREPRTVARRSHVRASVRARLAELTQVLSTASESVQNLNINRHRAGIPALDIFGTSNEIDYFSENEDVSEGAMTAVAVRPTSRIISAFRQTRRKMINVRSPAHASSAPDLLSEILENQTLLHSKSSVVSLTADGHVNIKLPSNEQKHRKQTENSNKDNKNKLDLTNGEDATRKVPSYPGQSRGGGWGGGYRGNYCPQGNSGFNRGSGYDSNRSGNYDNCGGYNRQGNFYQGNTARRDDVDMSYGNFVRRPHHDETFQERSRRPPQNEMNRSSNFTNSQRFIEQGRHSTGPSWQPYTVGEPSFRQVPSSQSRHSFGGMEIPLDMRMGQLPSQNSLNHPDDFCSNAEVRLQKPEPQLFQPLPEPPLFNFDKMQDVEKSEDERSDSGLIIDTDKYDPMEPTHDDDSGDENKLKFSQADQTSTSGYPPLKPTPQLQGTIPGIDTSLSVSPNVLDTGVGQVLHENRNSMVPYNISPQGDKSDEESEGDCPNFSIYSATSVHIANNTNISEIAIPQDQLNQDLEDLVQEDDDISTSEPPIPTTPSPTTPLSDILPTLPSVSESRENIINESSTPVKLNSDFSHKAVDEEYYQKVSKRCPITPTPRNPIKIKINTPSLIKRHVSLYDEEDASIETETSTKSEIDLFTQKIKNNLEALNSSNIPNVTPEDNNDSFLISSVKNIKQKENDIENFEDDRNQENFIKLSVDKEASINDVSSINSSDKEENGVGAHQDSSHEQEDNEVELEKHNVIDEQDQNAITDSEAEFQSQSPKKVLPEGSDEILEKMTESISETEDERSYTPCLDENKSKDTSMETDKEKGIEGLDTEMISEDECNEMFSEDEVVPSEKSHFSPLSAVERAVTPPPLNDEEETVKQKKSPVKEEVKKKKKKESKKDGKEKGKNKKKGEKTTEITFKKPSKSGKERNYRERDKEDKSKRRDKRDSSAERDRRRRKEKRKDLERYDVRTVVTEKRRRLKDQFGRDVSPARSRSRTPPRRGSLSPQQRSMSPRQRSISLQRRRSISPRRRTISPRRRTISPRKRSISPRRRSISLRRRSISPRRRSISPRRRSITPRKRSISPRRRSISQRRRSISQRRRSISARKITISPTRRKSISPRRPTPTSRKRRSSSPVRRRPRSSTPSPPKKRRRSASRRKKSVSPKLKAGKKKKRAERRKSKAKKRRSVSLNERSVEQRVWSPAASIDSRLLSPRTPPAHGSPPAPIPPPSLPSPPPRRDKQKRRRRDSERVHRRRPRDLVAPSKEVFTSGDNILVSVSFKEQERVDEGEERRRKKEAKRERRRRRKEGVAEVAETSKPVAIIDLERSPFRELTPSPKNVIVLSDSDGPEVSAAAEEPRASPDPPRDPPGPKTPPDHTVQPIKFTIGRPTVPVTGSDVVRDARTEAVRGPSTPPEPSSPAPSARSPPDAYDPFEPTASPSPRAASPPAPEPASEPERTSITLETAQKTNLSADDVIDRRPLSPMEKVMALLASTRDVSPEPLPQPAGPQPNATPLPGNVGGVNSPPEGVTGAPQSGPPVNVIGAPLGVTAPPPRIVLPSPTRHQPKLFLAKPSPIKSNPIKPMQATKISKLPLPTPVRRAPSDMDSPFGGDSPYSPGSSDFGDLFEPPGGSAQGSKPLTGKKDLFDSLFGVKPKQRKDKSTVAKVPVKYKKKKGKTQVGVKIDEDNLKILDELPSSAVEMQVKSKFLKKLNRQERVVEEVKFVLKPHYNKKHVTKEEYKHILRQCVPKICHNKSGEINPAKIQALVEAYVKKIRKKHKLGLV